MKKIITLILVAIAFQSSTLFAQELRCRVNIQYSEIANADKELFNTLRKTVEEFMNTRTWTDNVFEEHEKIEMRVNIRITKQISNKNFSGTIQIQSSRPVYKSTYTTTMFNHVDERVNIQYEENEALEFSENSYVSNLSSILAYYAYIVIGIDYDSYSSLGGTPYFQKAQNIVNTAQASNETGWNNSKDAEDNRYWLIENILNSSFVGFRNALYTYHRLGLDIMYEKPADGRKKILEAMSELENVYKIKPSLFLLTVFFYAKKEEINQVFSQANPEEKVQIVGLAKKMNPANVNYYDKILSK